jgi:large subunit ribosomal protein L22
MADENPDKKSSKKVAKKEPKNAAAKKESAAKKGDAKKAPKKAAAKKESAAKKAAKKDDGKKAAAKKGAKAKEPAKKAAPKVERKAPVVRASARFVRVAPRKARLVADQVRGLHIEKARALLRFSPRGAAQDIQKLIDSAAANAENNHDLVADEMRVATITVDEGPTLKRYRPRAQGRATPIHKRTSHIAVALTPTED